MTGRLAGLYLRLNNACRREPVIAASVVLAVSGNETPMIGKNNIIGPIVFFVGRPIREIVGIKHPLPLPQSYPCTYSYTFPSIY
jgi:hypothetical protein